MFQLLTLLIGFITVSFFLCSPLNEADILLSLSHMENRALIYLWAMLTKCWQIKQTYIFQKMLVFHGKR